MPPLAGEVNLFIAIYANTLTDDAAKRNWQLTIDQMTNHFKDLTAKGMTKGKKQITANEKKSIADLLTVLLGEE